ncbi:1,4-dihydroxy-2-naphthoate octaprenyltransferase [Marinomonas aquimarina]|uniref:1,4-dihydroxy-2-naphthoate octaprenyltransferase n=1 Tax=Marinomonas aquimarina TaxID=295068 RepID=A0A1A8TEM5_9GAMM|nr:prenyltransferase [Marinomonas aquimarina]SBS30540.1 1,4-dihydroxy-2-naphthoate octaprenyltransferase [Marinomonas aquimarina]
MSAKLPTLMQSARVPFLILAPVSVFLGISSAYVSATDIQWLHVALAVLAAILAHISVNAFNEYMDYRSGLDLKTERTPFSGGSGGLVDNPSALNSVLAMAWITLLLTMAIGGYFIYLRGEALLWLGAIGVLLVVGYTPWINRSPLLCWMAPGLGFGPVMVLGTHIALTGDLNGLALLLSLVPFMLANNLLLLNQFPDIDADRANGRRHVPIIYGKAASLALYSLGLLVASFAVVIGCVFELLPWLSLLALVPLALGMTVVLGLKPLLRKGAATWLPYLGRNVVMTLVTPIILGTTLILG